MRWATPTLDASATTLGAAGAKGAGPRGQCQDQGSTNNSGLSSRRSRQAGTRGPARRNATDYTLKLAVACPLRALHGGQRGPQWATLAGASLQLTPVFRVAPIDSQAENAGSIPVIRSTRKGPGQKPSTSELGLRRAWGRGHLRAMSARATPLPSCQSSSVE